MKEVAVSITRDGNQVCALIGENIQEGYAGFGDTIPEALGGVLICPSLRRLLILAILVGTVVAMAQGEVSRQFVVDTSNVPSYGIDPQLVTKFGYMGPGLRKEHVIVAGPTQSGPFKSGHLLLHILEFLFGGWLCWGAAESLGQLGGWGVRWGYARLLVGYIFFIHGGILILYILTGNIVCGIWQPTWKKKVTIF